ncbi:Zn finger protein [Elasticomyces elasticus]|nr:Zn finger protein [Elasticomyces elasticus]
MATFAPSPNMLSPPNPFNVPQYPRGIAMQPPYAPTSSTTPPSATASPTSHGAHIHAKHIGRPKQPLYVPAVLRPTEMPLRTMPLTPPRSTNNSFDSASSARAVSASYEQGALLGADSVLRVDRVVSDEWEDEALGDVTGLPTRNHWKGFDNTLTDQQSPTGLLPRAQTSPANKSSPSGAAATIAEDAATSSALPTSLTGYRLTSTPASIPTVSQTGHAIPAGPTTRRGSVRGAAEGTAPSVARRLQRRQRRLRRSVPETSEARRQSRRSAAWLSASRETGTGAPSERHLD